MKSKKTTTEVLMDVWSLSKDHKLPWPRCEKEFTRKEKIAHLIKAHKWKPADARDALKKVKLKKGQAVI
jgi:uncharacterized C2H2 Zn-finger protein